MVLIFILAASVLLQFITAFLAIRLIKVTGRRIAWLLIATAVSFQAIRRTIVLFRLLSGDLAHSPDPAAEIVWLAITIFMLIGIVLIAPIFYSFKRSEEKLRESEKRFRTVADFTYDWEYWIGTDGNYIYISPSCERITGYSVGEFFQSPYLFKSIIHPDDRESVMDHHKMTLEKRESCDIDFRIITKSGEERWIGHTCQPVYDNDGRWIGQRGGNRDITRRKKSEMELHKVNRALKTLSQCNQAIVFAVDEVSLLQDVCRVTTEIGGYRMAWVGYAEQDENKTVRPAAQSGFDEGYLNTANITWADTDLGQGPTGTAIRTGKPSICKNMLTDPKYSTWRAEAAGRGYQSSIALPLISRGKTFGALNIYAGEPDAFDDEELKLLTEMADDLAYGIDSLCLREERNKAEEVIKSSLKEKEILLKEVHHRVKNNLQVISSILDMSSLRTTDQYAIKLFEDAIIKINTMALFHSQIYQSERFENINAKTHIESMVTYLKRFYEIKIDLEYHVSVDPEIALTLYQGIPFTLVITELTANAIKHAFKDQNHGTIEIYLNKKYGNTVCARVKDNGIGIPEEIDPLNTNILGLKLIRNLVRDQLKGTIEYRRDHGTEVIFEFDILEQENDNE